MKLYYLLALVIGLNACAPIYIPNVVHAPLFTEKGDADISVHTGISGVDAHVAYAPTNFMGVMVNGSFANRGSGTNNFHVHNYAEASVGLFKKLESEFVMEAYAGIGGGNIRSSSDNTFWLNDVTASNFKYFIQPTLGYKTKNFESALVLRYANVSVRQNNIKYQNDFIEPVGLIKVGTENVKFTCQAGFSATSANSFNSYDYQPLIMSVGVVARLNVKKGLK